MKRYIICFAVLVLLGFYSYWSNNNIVTTQIGYSNIKIPSDFKGYRIVQVSDLHNKEFGIENEILLNKIKDMSPDIIVVTGDLIDKGKTEVSLKFMENAVKIAPVYYVSGNHDKDMKDFNDYVNIMEEMGITTLENKMVNIEKNSSVIQIVGITDIKTNPDYKEVMKKLIDKSKFNILLSHRPERFDEYVKVESDLVFTGHAHGGQFRLPFIGGLIAPNQGFFPKYSSGIYKDKSTSMVVSRGLGGSIIPQRIGNRPELVVVTLNS